MSRLRRATPAFGLAVILAGPPVQAGDGLETFGDLMRYGIPLAAGGISAARDDREGLAQLGATFGVTLVLTEGLKETFDGTGWGKRPNGGREAFPSGHAAKAFSGAAYLHFRYGWEYGLPAAAVASVVGYSRVESDDHHVRDVIAGAALAYTTAFFLTEAVDDSATLIPLVGVSKPYFGLIGRLRF
ncbi:phosphatase PAP2 family protein [Arenibaculum pallidiluteum]|uniref:phosphatase PAP2 family protein n=1 Tax=Arenibaculum pallidiluteum TaxID=2812559 RepID=UPI001A956644|nr:phosphatase PAP2 family protein [Arenibaculum pallidiluteum]